MLGAVAELVQWVHLHPMIFTNGCFNREKWHVLGKIASVQAIKPISREGVHFFLHLSSGTPLNVVKDHEDHLVVTDYIFHTFTQILSRNMHDVMTESNVAKSPKNHFVHTFTQVLLFFQDI